MADCYEALDKSFTYELSPVRTSDATTCKRRAKLLYIMLMEEFICPGMQRIKVIDDPQAMPAIVNHFRSGLSVFPCLFCAVMKDAY